MAASLVYWISLIASVTSLVYGVTYNNFVSHTYTISDDNHIAVFSESNYTRSLFHCLVHYSDNEQGFIIFDARQNLCLHRDCNIEQYNELSGTNIVRQLTVVPDHTGIIYEAVQHFTTIIDSLLKH